MHMVHITIDSHDKLQCPDVNYYIALSNLALQETKVLKHRSKGSGNRMTQMAYYVTLTTVGTISLCATTVEEFYATLSSALILSFE